LRRQNRQQVVMHCMGSVSWYRFSRTLRRTNASIRSLSAEVAKRHQWNVEETTAFPQTTVGPSCFKCRYINFDNDKDRSYRRPITVIIHNTLRVWCIGLGAPDDDAITDVTTVNKQNGASYVLLSFQFLNSNFINFYW